MKKPGTKNTEETEYRNEKKYMISYIVPDICSTRSKKKTQVNYLRTTFSIWRRNIHVTYINNTKNISKSQFEKKSYLLVH